MINHYVNIKTNHQIDEWHPPQLEPTNLLQVYEQLDHGPYVDSSVQEVHHSLLATSPEYSDDSDVELWGEGERDLTFSIMLAPSSPHEYLLTLVQELRLVLEKKHQDAAFVSRFFSNYGDCIFYYAETFEDESYKQRLYKLSQTMKTMSQGFGNARFVLLPPFLRSRLSEAKVKQLKRQLSSIEFNILCN